MGGRLCRTSVVSGRPKLPKNIFCYLDLEVTPHAPSLQKSHIHAGSLLKLAWESQQAPSGGFGVRNAKHAELRAARIMQHSPGSTAVPIKQRNAQHCLRYDAACSIARTATQHAAQHSAAQLQHTQCRTL
jgi:hypothetical protein